MIDRALKSTEGNEDVCCGTIDFETEAPQVSFGETITPSVCEKAGSKEPLRSTEVVECKRLYSSIPVYERGAMTPSEVGRLARVLIKACKRRKIQSTSQKASKLAWIMMSLHNAGMVDEDEVVEVVAFARIPKAAVKPVAIFADKVDRSAEGCIIS